MSVVENHANLAMMQLSSSTPLSRTCPLLCDAIALPRVRFLSLWDTQQGTKTLHPITAAAKHGRQRCAPRL